MADASVPVRSFAFPRAIGWMVLWGFAMLPGHAVLAQSPPGEAVTTPPASGKELLLFMQVPTVVSGTGKEQPLTEAPSAISVVSGEQIHDSGATSIPDALRFVPGLDFKRNSASDVSIGARGLVRPELARIQVLLDGQSVYEDVLSLVYWHQIPVPLAEIDHIEVVKSPSSALYGDRAFGGLVNIVTKSPEALRGTFIRQTAGEAGTEITDIIHGGTAGPLAYKLSVGYDRTNQFPNPEVGRTSDQLGREDVRAHAYLEARPGESSKLSLTGGFDRFERREFLPAVPTPPPFAAAQGVVSGYLGYGQLNYALDDFKAQLSYNRADVDLASDSLPRPGTAVLDVFQGQLRHSISLGGSHVLTAGGSYRFVSMDSGVLVGGSVRQHLGTFFVQEEWRLLDNLLLTAGVGVDVHPQAGVSASPRVALVYTPWANHTFRLSFAEAFRNPTILETFQNTLANLVPAPGVPPPGVTLRDQVRGSTRLDPERMKSYEAGYQGRFFERIKTRIDFFYAEYADLMSFGRAVKTQQSPQELLFTQTNANVGGGDAIGVEPEIEVFFTSWLTGFVNYSFQHRTGKLLAMGSAPNHKGNAGLTLSLGHGFWATAFAHISGPLDVPDSNADSFATLDLQLAYRFKVFGKEAELAAYAFNLLNDRHRETTGGDLIDRRVTGTLRVGF